MVAEKPPSNEVILYKMLEECFDDYKKDHWLLHNKRDLRIIQRWCKGRTNHHCIRHFKSRNRTQLLNQSIRVTAEQYKDYPGKLSNHLLRNGFAGIGHKNKALRRRPLSLACRWSSRVFDTNYIQLFNWNAGNLSRNCRGDTLNDVLISPYHIETVQEASTVTSQPALMEARGIASASSRDGTIMINSGGVGYNMVRKTHSEEDQFCDWIQRPFYYDQEPPQFDLEEIAELERTMLEARERKQADLLEGDSDHEVILPIADPDPGHSAAAAVTSELCWEAQIEKGQQRIRCHSWRAPAT